ncbi:STAS domain-containing protein [Variovorax sp. PCZ-1]|nr:STAS domain-containing protein [Variovorax sp. PCZ-1]
MLMAKDDTSPGGLFSKMVKFVRSPGTQWNDLDDASSAKDGSLSKQALKEMIERKRRNDFVRKREFDMLRKLRRREATGAGSASDAAARPSFFQSSMPSRPDDRAMTLKKIDEIEAQMSMQWWKTKHGAAGGASTNSPSSDFSASDMASRPPAANAAAKSAAASNNLAYARTAPDDLQSALGRVSAKFNPDAAAGAQPPASVPVVTARVPAPSTPSAATSSSPAVPRFSDVPAIRPTLSSASARMASPAPTAAAPAPAPAPAADDDNSLDFTADFAPAAKPQIKSSPFSAASPAPVAQPATASKPPGAIGALGGLAASYDGTGAVSGFTASKLFALEVDEVQHDPELEEAAIRFANGDDGGAEAGLLEAVSARGPRHQHEETWLTLFDLYRATSQYDRFESLAIDFASKFNRSSPMWFSIPEMVSKMTGGNEPAAPVGLRKADWKSPANFGIQSLAALNGALSKASMPWTLDWVSIQSVEDNAVAPLTKLLLSWVSQPVQLRMAHTDKLEKVLRDGAPSGVRTTDQDRWNLLMAYLRVAHRPDEFELAALDFCVTYEVSPPSWEPARCEFKSLDADGNTGVGQTIIGDAVHDSVVSEMHTDAGSSLMTAQLASVELSGQIMGEPKPVLDKLEARLTGADMMIISCAKLVRVDFSAAGSLLNWVTARQSEGRVVQFTDVHRLVAAFFHVIGISEHAKVTTRVD